MFLHAVHVGMPLQYWGGKRYINRVDPKQPAATFIDFPLTNGFR